MMMTSTRTLTNIKKNILSYSAIKLFDNDRYYYYYLFSLKIISLSYYVI